MKHAIVACAALLGLVALTAANNDFCLWPKRPDGMRPDAASAKYVDRYRRVKVGSKIYFDCPSGYSLGDGRHDFAICYSYGWYGLEVNWKKCIRRSRCDRRSAPDNGSVSKPKNRRYFVIGEKVRFSCKKGFRLEGSDTDTCGKDGEWVIDERPTCVKIKCRPRPSLPNGYISPLKKYYYLDDEVHYSCKKRYVLIGNPKNKCAKDDKWLIKDNPTCVITCPDRSAPSKGFVKISQRPIIPRTTLRFSCKDGYRLVGEKNDLCLKDGSWQVNKTPKCVLITCPKRMAPNAGSVSYSSEPIVPGVTLKFECKKGYLLSGRDDDVCEKDGSWKYGGTPRCRLIECPARSAPSKGSVTYSRKPPLVPSTTLTFTCREGYRLKGRKDDVCLGNGRWKYGQTVTCELILCPRRRAPKDGSVTVVANPPGSPQYSPGAKLTFICDKGFDLKGYPFDKCQDDGTWRDNKRVECVPRKRKCGDIYGPDNGGIVGGGQDYYYSGDKVHFVCDKGYVLDVVIKDECRSNGKWKYADAHPPKFPVCRRPPGY